MTREVLVPSSMPGSRPAPGPARLPARVLIVLGLLVGLLGMHGLGADHDVAGPAHATVLAASPGTAADRTAADHMAADHAAPTPDGHVLPPTDDGSPDGHLTDTAEACLAVLAGAALLALLLPGAARVPQPARWELDRSGARGRIPPLPALRPPDLSVLCVLRT